MKADVAELPAHVPAALVQHFSFDDEPGIDSDPAAAMDAARDGRPIIYAPTARRGLGTWVVKQHDLIVEAMQATDLFSSDRYSGFSQLLGEDWPMIPLEVDPPIHRPYRILLNKVFSPSRMATLEGGILETVRQLNDGLRQRGGCEFQSAFGMPLPTTVFLRLMGLPLEDAPDLLDWEEKLLHGRVMPERIAAARSIKDYLLAHLANRKRTPRDDVVSFIANADLEGRLLTSDEQLGIAFVLYGAGLDTVAAALGFSFRYLAIHQDKQAELRANPGLRAKAVEELLRANSMVVPSRWVTRDVSFHGVEMKQGDAIALPTMFHNRDPAMFENPTAVDFARSNVQRHISFGAGPHNCLGAHLARRELKIVIDEWMETMPTFRLGPEEALTYGGSVFGVTSLSLAW